ncbi:MAG: L-seryl-tRNA(Sec) selenium transferase [Pirellulales bacterium]
MSQSFFRRLPTVQELLDSPPLRRLVQTAHRTSVATGVQHFLDAMRDELRTATADIPAPADLAERIASWIAAQKAAPPGPAINAAGVLFSTELQGPLLAEEAQQALHRAARDRSLGADESANRDRYVENQLAQLAGAEAAAVFHAGPGALLTTLATLAPSLDVVVARGQVADIQGLALPELIAAARARLREVGVANRVTVDDYAPFLAEQAGVLLQLAPRNYAVVGDKVEPSLEELAGLSRTHRVPLVAHLGAGGVVDLPQSASPWPSASSALQAGVDLCVLDGDGLLGGPACGVVVGRREWVDRICEHPLRTALRADRLAIAALAATLDLYLAQPVAWSSLPLAALLAAPVENLQNRAERMAPQWAALPGVEASAATACRTTLGAATGAAHDLPSWGVELRVHGNTGVELAARLRRQTPAVVARVLERGVLLDLRGVLPRQDVELIGAVEAAVRAAAKAAD